MSEQPRQKKVDWSDPYGPRGELEKWVLWILMGLLILVLILAQSYQTS